jgi:hypothetical protein
MNVCSFTHNFIINTPNVNKIKLTIRQKESYSIPTHETQWVLAESGFTMFFVIQGFSMIIITQPF